MKILSAEQMRVVENYTMEHQPVSSIDLMERAAVAACEVLEQRFAPTRPLVIFCGPGNNGGDGLAIARLMAAKGRAVSCFLFNIRGKLSENCQINRDRLDSAVRFQEITSSFVLPEMSADAVVIDALFGIGLSRPLEGGFASLVRSLNATGCTIVSIDTPSGLMCEVNDARQMVNMVHANLTLTMHRPKLAHLFAENEPMVGELVVLNIGIMDEADEDVKSQCYVTEESDIRAMLRRRSRFAHKGSVGHALLLTGSLGMAGAAILSACACLRAGVGKVTVATDKANIVPLQVATPETVVRVASEHISRDMVGQYDAIGVGPGLGVTDMTGELHTLLRYCDKPMVVDADAINLLALRPEWLRLLPAESVLTPHPKELERLVGGCMNSHERMTKALDLAQRHNIYVLVKGHYSMVCTPRGVVYFNPTGNAGMATAGSGDVLTGIITALLAQGYSPEDALRLGVWWHGKAGDMAAQKVGCEESIIASDITDNLGWALRELMANT